MKQRLKQETGSEEVRERVRKRTGDRIVVVRPSFPVRWSLRAALPPLRFALLFATLGDSISEK